MASENLLGSLSYMPSTFVALSIASAPISMALRAAAVSVVQKGLPVPAVKMTTLPFSRWRMARPLMKVSATEDRFIAERTRAGCPSVSSCSFRARPLMTVPSMPIVSAVACSTLPSFASVAPRMMLPPPMTTASCVPTCAAIAISFAIFSSSSPSMPNCPSLQSDSPETLRRTRL